MCGMPCPVRRITALGSACATAGSRTATSVTAAASALLPDRLTRGSLRERLVGTRRSRLQHLPDGALANGVGMAQHPDLLARPAVAETAGEHVPDVARAHRAGLAQHPPVARIRAGSR